MHISEGILSAPVLVTGAGLTAVAVGYSLKKMEHKEVPKIAILSSVFFVASLIHVPIAVFWWELSLGATLGYLLLTTVFGIGSAFAFARTKNVAASIFLHVLWEWPIMLFR